MTTNELDTSVVDEAQEDDIKVDMRYFALYALLN